MKIRARFQASSPHSGSVNWPGMRLIRKEKFDISLPWQQNFYGSQKYGALATTAATKTAKEIQLGLH